jgi:hypothetical protein
MGYSEYVNSEKLYVESIKLMGKNTLVSPIRAEFPWKNRGICI